eukprot:15451933-Alexandrium_andersonii.AAC.1
MRSAWRSAPGRFRLGRPRDPGLSLFLLVLAYREGLAIFSVGTSLSVPLREVLATLHRRARG